MNKLQDDRLAVLHKIAFLNNAIVTENHNTNVVALKLHYAYTD